MSNEIHILDLSWRAKLGGGGNLKEDGTWTHSKVPYLIVNCVFRCDPGYYRDRAMGRAQDYRLVTVTGSPEEEERAFQAQMEEAMVKEASEEGYDMLADWINRANNQPTPKRVWTYDDPLWHHIEKFNVFWFREWVADCSVTRAALQELRLYQTEGSVRSVYRTTDEEIVLKHLETIQSYWD
jgi:hypothetical protein